jgi:hypothetical protein
MQIGDESSSMSVCHTCHVPYTQRDIYVLNLDEYLDTGDRRYGSISYPMKDGQANGLRSRSSHAPPDSPDSPLSSETSVEANQAHGMTVPALLQRIRELEAAVNHRDSQIREWRKYVWAVLYMYIILTPRRFSRQFDKNAQSLLVQLREVRDLKQEVMDWWRRVCPFLHPVTRSAI